MASIDLTASATFPDGTEDPDAQFAWSIDDEAVAVVSAAGNLATVLAQSAGSANVTVVATNPDGSSVLASIKLTITSASQPVQDAVAVAITAGTPVNDDQFEIAAGDSSSSDAPAAGADSGEAPTALRTVVVDGVERAIG